jgi:hypothetical protein
MKPNQSKNIKINVDPVRSAKEILFYVAAGATALLSVPLILIGGLAQAGWLFTMGVGCLTLAFFFVVMGDHISRPLRQREIVDLVSSELGNRGLVPVVDVPEPKESVDREKKYVSEQPKAVLTKPFSNRPMATMKKPPKGKVLFRLVSHTPKSAPNRIEPTFESPAHEITDADYLVHQPSLDFENITSRA